MTITVNERVGELEDALEQCMGIWERALDGGNSKSAGAEMIRVIRLASLRRLDDGTTIEEVRALSLKELRHQVLSQQSALDTAREMLKDWNPTPMADTLRVLEGDLDGSLTEEQQAEILAARERLSAVPTLQWAGDIPEIDLLRKLVGVQRLQLMEAGIKAREDFISGQARRMGESGGRCPKCDHNLMGGR